MPSYASMTVVALAALAACAPPPPSAVPGPPADPPTVVAKAPEWPFWAPVPVHDPPPPPGAAWPPPLASIARTGGAEALWEAASPAVRAEVEQRGLAKLPAGRRGFGVGAFYEGLACARTPALLTVEALAAVAFVAVEAALADVERDTARAMQTLLQRLGVRLAAAEPEAQPDLTAGLHVAEGVVAVGLSLLDPSYPPPREVRDAVARELGLARAHAGVAVSPVLGLPFDYTLLAPRGAAGAGGASIAAYQAAEWLASAAFVFDASEASRRVNMSAARARTRGALLVSRLVMDGPDADAPAREALRQLDQLGRLTFGPAAGASPSVLARFAQDHGFDLHDASLIAAPASLDRIRRQAATSLGSMLLVPLRRAPEGDARQAGAVVSWLESPDWTSRAGARHESFYASALDAVATWLGPSFAEAPSAPWQEHKLEGGRALWALLRHGAVPYGRVSRRAAAGEGDAPCPRESPAAPVLVERHPEALAALLAYVTQVLGGLEAVRAIDDRAPAAALLRDVQDILSTALEAAEATEPSNAQASVARLAALPGRLARVEARVGPAAGPFAVTVQTDPGAGKALREATLGLDSLFVVVRDPATGRAELAVGATLAEAEEWVAASAGATDEAWATQLASAAGAGP